MAPVCDTRTERAHEDCVCYTTPWWEHPASLLPKKQMPFTTSRNTTMLSDYQYRGSGLSGNTRYGANKDRVPAVGTGTMLTMLRLQVAIGLKKLLKGMPGW